MKATHFLSVPSRDNYLSLLAIALLSSSSCADGFQNGDFEAHTIPHNPASPDGYYYAGMSVGDTAVTGWTWVPGVGSEPGFGEYIRGYFQDASPARGGLVELGSYYSSIGLAQTFPTLPETIYSVSLYVASNPINLDRGPGKLQVGAGGWSGEIEAPPGSNNPDAMGWELRQFSFLSDASGQTTLSFRNTQGVVELDSVRVTAIPEPDTISWMLSAIAGASVYRLLSKTTGKNWYRTR